MNIVILVDSEVQPKTLKIDAGTSFRGKDDMEFDVASSAAKLGHDVTMVPLSDDVVETIGQLRSLKTKLVFNLTEHAKGDRTRDYQLAAALDLAGIRYTGSGADGLLLARNKALSKTIVAKAGVRVPRFVVLLPGSRLDLSDVPLPGVVKPLFGDSSEGISQASIVTTRLQARRRIRYIHREFDQPAICEEYISGREIYLGIIGNAKPTAFGLREYYFGRLQAKQFRVASHPLKHHDAYRRRVRAGVRDARLRPDLARTVRMAGITAYRALSLRDYARIDFRVTADGVPVFLEANPNPALAPDKYSQLATWSGTSHRNLIRQIINFALARSV